MKKWIVWVVHWLKKASTWTKWNETKEKKRAGGTRLNSRLKLFFLLYAGYVFFLFIRSFFLCCSLSWFLFFRLSFRFQYFPTNCFSLFFISDIFFFFSSLLFLNSCNTTCMTTIKTLDFSSYSSSKWKAANYNVP